MIGKLFKKPTSTDLLEELKKSTLKEDKVNQLLESLDINHLNQNRQNFLHLMINENKIESIKWLLKKNIDINSIDSKGETPLMIACKNGFFAAVDELIKKNADVNIESYSGYTAIEFAIYNNHTYSYKVLKNLVSNINRKNRKDETLLHIAIKAKNIDIINDLFEDEKFKVEENILFYKESFKDENILKLILKRVGNFHRKDYNNRNILFYVVENGIKSHQVFTNLLKENLDINCIDNNGNNILLHLIEFILYKENNLVIDTPEDTQRHKDDIKNLMDLIPIIIEHNINTKVINNKNKTALSLPAKSKNLPLLSLLLDCDITVDLLDRNNNSTLSLVVKKGKEYLDIIHLLLDYGASANIKDINNQTVIEKLIDAILISREEKKAKNLEKKDIDFNSDYNAILVSVLVNTDVNLTLLNSKAEPYIFEALRYGAIDIIKLLLKHGADINEPDLNGNNIIYKFMAENQTFQKEKEQKEYYNNLQAIIIMGANVNAKDSFGGITLHKAILDSDLTVIKMLLHSGADMNAIDNRGRTILHNAIWKNNVKIFKLIYSYNKSLLNEPDKFGVTPLNYAAFLGYTELVLEFIELNAHINNPYRKTKYILNFLKKFHKNLKSLVDNARTKTQKDKIKILVENMRKEFEVED